MKKKYTLDNNTVASNPGKINFKQFVWMKYNYKFVLIIIPMFLLSIYVAVSYSKYFYVVTVILVLINELYWLRLKEHYSADSNAGLVISTNPKLVAVYTNLTKGYGGNYPVIKIINYKVRRPVDIGERIATVAVYSVGENDDLGCWADFFPLPADYATDNKNEIEAEINSYPQEQWQKIYDGLSEINKPYKTGLYKIELTSSDWENELE